MLGIKILILAAPLWVLPTVLANKCPSEGSEDPRVNVFLNHETNCNKFYECSHGVAIEMNCPSNLYFNLEMKYCDYPHNVDCKQGSSIDDVNNHLLTNETNLENGQNNNGSCPAENPTVDVLYPHETDCSKFYKCSDGNKVLQECPAGLYYNPERQYCDWPSNVKCTNNNETNTTINPNVSDNTTNNSDKICPSENPVEDILYPHETNCSLFYKCFNGKLVAHKCPPNLYYNPDKQFCDWPDNVNCSNNPNNNSIVMENCLPEDSEDDLFPHEYNCNAFYQCKNGKKVPAKCPSGFYFNPNINSCDLPENVNCAN